MIRLVIASTMFAFAAEGRLGKDAAERLLQRVPFRIESRSFDEIVKSRGAFPGKDEEEGLLEGAAYKHHRRPKHASLIEHDPSSTTPSAEATESPVDSDDDSDSDSEMMTTTDGFDSDDETETTTAPDGDDELEVTTTPVPEAGDSDEVDDEESTASTTTTSAPTGAGEQEEGNRFVSSLGFGGFFGPF